MSREFSRFFLLITVSITILFASAGLQAQQVNQQFRGGGPLLAKSDGTGPFYGNETGTNTWYGDNAGHSITTGSHNSFFGMKAGWQTSGGTYPQGSRNSFFGSDAGVTNTVGNHNSFFGSAAGFLSMGHENAFFGAYAGYSNKANYNSFFGTYAGYSNTTGPNNAFFGAYAGYKSDGGWYNSFFGNEAGRYNITGHYNSFFGNYAGLSNTVESNNTFIGASSDGTAGITNATAVGYHAKVAQSNSLVLGSIKGINGATADTRVGIGTTAPLANLHVQNGGIYVGSPNQGVILKSPDGTKCAKLSIDNSGALVTALQACPETAPPEKAILISPTGTNQSSTPTYKWNAVSNASWYRLWVNDSSTSGRITTWHTAAQAGCSSGFGVCSVTPSIPLASGSAKWWIQTWNEFGYGDWSDEMTFAVR